MNISFTTGHCDYVLKEPFLKVLHDHGHRAKDFGTYELNPKDDYPDIVIPLARAVTQGKVERSIAICGNGVGASFAANKIPGVRSALIHESFSFH